MLVMRLKRISNVLLNIFLHRLVYKIAGKIFFFLLEIVGFSHGMESIFKAVIGEYNLLTICLHSHRRKQCITDIQREKKSGLRTKIKSFHSGYSN